MPKTYDDHRAESACRAATESMTMAMKAKRLLAANAIRASVVKISSEQAKRGCTYGIEFQCALYGNVNAILSAAGIKTDKS